MQILPLRVACTLLLTCLLASCADDVAAPRDARAPQVTATTVGMQPWNDTVQALGTVKARESVTLTSKVSETVESVRFDSGDRVKAGQVLVSLSEGAQRAELVQAQAAANEAEKLYRRQAELAGQQLIARSALDSQAATRDAARARVAQMRAQAGDRTIRAPFDGVLGLRQVSQGSLVTPGTPIATLDDIQRVYVDFPVPEAMLANLAEGQQLSATSAAWPGRTFTGTVSTVDTRIDPSTRAVTVRGDFDNPDLALRPGLLLQVTLSRPQRQALLVPEISIVQVGNSAYVFRIKPDGTVERADIEVGGRRQGVAEITAGLQAGDRIVVDGTGKLRPGEKVDVQSSTARDSVAGAAASDQRAIDEKAIPESRKGEPRRDAPPKDVTQQQDAAEGNSDG